MTLSHSRSAVCLSLLLLVLLGLTGFGAPPAAEEEKIRKLIQQLGDDDFDKRQEATKQLEALGQAALPLLRKASKESPDAEVRRRTADLVADLQKSAFGVVRTFEAAPLVGIRRWLSRLVVTPDGKQAVTAGDECLIRWDIATGKKLKVFGNNPKAYWALALSRDGQRLIAGGDDHLAHVWDLEKGQELCRLAGHTGDIWGVALSADGKLAVTGAFDQTIRVWDAQTGKQTLQFEGVRGNVRCLALSPDGKLVAAGHNSVQNPAGVVRLWDVPTGKEVRACQGHTREVAAVAFSPDGATILSGSFDGTVRLWETRTGKAVRVFKGHKPRVEAVAFADAGRLVLSAGDEEDHSVRLWDAASGEELYACDTVRGGFLSVVPLPQERHFLTTGKESGVQLWRWSK
jgi:WD40 repeat protein